MGGIAVLLCALGAGAMAGWALHVVLVPDAGDAVDDDFAVVTVEEGEVSSGLTLNTIAHWPVAHTAANQAAGIVTSVGVEPGQIVSPGQTIYSVDLRPVIVAQGEVPAFRSLGVGAEGDDVVQLQRMLRELGHLSNEPDGKFEQSTAAAVKSWQRSLGLATNGIVELGDLVYVPELPARVSLDPAVVRTGLAVGGGEAVVQTLAAQPEFRLPVSESQSASVRDGARVEITSPSGSTWEGWVSGRVRDAAAQTVSVSLAGADGASICRETCEEIGVQGETALRSNAILVEAVQGLTVPSAAIATDATGALFVVTTRGDRLPIDVIAAAKGMSIVEGVPGGTDVRIPQER